MKPRPSLWLLPEILTVLLLTVSLLIGCTKTPTPTQPSTPSPTPAPNPTPAPAPTPSPTLVSSLNCQTCHADIHTKWAGSPHGDTQTDVASELADARAGQTPSEVIQGKDAENCVACHSPTAVLANGGMTETQALNYFFTTTDGKFTKDTDVAHAADWPQVACTACHDLMNLKIPSYFNSATKKYQPMKDASELCGQCHGNLRFPGTDHLSYNILNGTGGIGVSDQQTMPGATCTSCHMFVSNVDGSKSAMFHGHTFAITVQEADGKSTTSCTSCHSDMDTAATNKAIDGFKSSFQTLDATAQKNVTAAADAMKGVEDKALQSKLDEAQHNLEYAESDESGGFHNHNYLRSLLNDANNKALEILSALGK